MPPLPPEFIDVGDIRDLLFAALSSAVFASVLASFLTHRLVQRRSQRALKRDVLMRFVGSRFALTSSSNLHLSDGDPFVSLNQISVVFAKDAGVRRALRTMFDNLHTPDKLTANVVALIRQMARAADVKLEEEWDDDFFARPFAPPGREGGGGG